jgi:hypothetical protein
MEIHQIKIDKNKKKEKNGFFTLIYSLYKKNNKLEI